jgi:hypothetical protein
MSLDKRLLGRLRQAGPITPSVGFSLETATTAIYNVRWLIVTVLFLVAYIGGFIYLSASKDYPLLKDYSVAGMIIFVVGLLIGFLVLLGQVSSGAAGGIIPSLFDGSLWSSIGRQSLFIVLILVALAMTFSLIYVFSGDSLLSTTLMYMLITAIFVVAGITLFYRAYRGGEEAGLGEAIADFFRGVGFWISDAWTAVTEALAPIVRDIYNTPRYVIYLMIGLTVFLMGWFFLPQLINAAYSINGTVLQKEAVSMNHPTSVGTFENLSSSAKVPPRGRGVRRGGVTTNVPSDGNFNYRYSLSAWIFLNQQTSSPDSGGGFQTLLNYGEKPSIQYDANTKTLRIITREGVSDTTILYEAQDIPLQRWNHFVINYADGTMDVFLNGKLVATKRGVVPYMKNDKVIIGQQAGIEGGCANIVYYREPLSWWSIQTLYNSLKSLSVPYI